MARKGPEVTFEGTRADWGNTPTIDIEHVTFEKKLAAHTADVENLEKAGWRVRAGFCVLTAAVAFVVASLLFN